MKDEFTRSWIIENAVDVIREYSSGELTIRALHYRLVARGMTNTQQHYKRVVGAMIKARWDGTVSFETFSDHDRSMIGETKYEETNVEDYASTAKRQVHLWMNNYSKNRWENQPNYVEVFIEKKALQGVFGPICNENDVALGACKGYPSLTFINDTMQRIEDARNEGKSPIILYFGDYDPSGEDIPRSIVQNIRDMGSDVTLVRCALMEDQVVEWKLPPAPAKKGDSRTANWDGLGQVELDAVEPKKLRQLCQDSIDQFFNNELYDELIEREKEERTEFRQELKVWFNDKMNDDE